MTTTPAQATEIESIEVINGEQVLFVTNEVTAKKLLKRNPRARVVKGNETDDRFAVICKVTDCNLMSGVKTG